MTDLITAEEAEKLLDHYGLPTDCDCNDEDCVKCSHYPTLQERASKKLKEISPDLARTIIALHAQLADAQAAQAMVVERATESIAAIERLAISASIASCTCDVKTPDITFHAADCRYVKLQYIIAQCEDFRALAPIDGLALVRELRAERDRLNDECDRHCDAEQQADGLRYNAEAERDTLAAANAVLEAKVAGLREAVDEQTKARAQHWLRRTMTAPEDAEVEALCERCGYGAVMDAASRLWARKPYGSGAFYIGGCIGFKSDEEARAALATQEAGT